MSISNDVLRAWVRPRAVMRGLLDRGEKESRALIILMAGCLLTWVAQWPRLSREATSGLDIPVEALIQEALVVWLFFVPLVAYVLAVVIYLVARLLRTNVTGYGARLALFWTLLASAPASLLFGLSSGFLGDSAGTSLVGGVLIAGFIWILGQSLREAVKG